MQALEKSRPHFRRYGNELIDVMRLDTEEAESMVLHEQIQALTAGERPSFMGPSFNAELIQKVTDYKNAFTGATFSIPRVQTRPSYVWEDLAVSRE
jgi:hypothetical protein